MLQRVICPFIITYTSIICRFGFDLETKMLLCILQIYLKMCYGYIYDLPERLPLGSRFISILTVYDYIFLEKYINQFILEITDLNNKEQYLTKTTIRTMTKPRGLTMIRRWASSNFSNDLICSWDLSCMHTNYKVLNTSIGHAYILQSVKY